MVHMANAVALRRKTGENPDSEAVYGPKETICCRFERAGKLAKRRDGTRMMSRAVIYTNIEVFEDDLVEYGGVEYPVISAAQISSLAGGVMHYEAFLGGDAARTSSFRARGV